MAALVFGIAALIGTVVVAAYGPQTWLFYWDQLGQTRRHK
jgi:hypothetical protein